MQKGTNELTPPKFEIDIKHDGWANISCSKYGYCILGIYVNKNHGGNDQLLRSGVYVSRLC